MSNLILISSEWFEMIKRALLIYIVPIHNRCGLKVLLNCRVKTYNIKKSQSDGSL